MAEKPRNLLEVNKKLLFAKRDLEYLFKKDLDVSSKEFTVEWNRVLEKINNIRDDLTRYIDALTAVAAGEESPKPLAYIQATQKKLREARDAILVIDFGRSRQSADLVRAAEVIEEAHKLWN